jgi:hypothetical protein
VVIVGYEAFFDLSNVASLGSGKRRVWVKEDVVRLIGSLEGISVTIYTDS